MIKEKLSSVWEYIKSIPEKVVETVLNFISTIGNFLVNLVSEVITGIKNLFLKLWDTAVQFFNNFGFLLLGPIGIFIKLGTVVHENWDLIKNKISSIFESFKNTIKNLAEQIKSFFAKPFEYMSEAIAGAKEKVLDFARKIPGVKYLVGEKENVAKVNGSHANGLNYVPFDGYIAELHKGERVLTKDENESIFGSLRNRLHSATQSNQSENSSKETNVIYQINNTFNFTGVSEDTKDSIIEKLQEKLNKFERQLEKMKEERETYARTSL